MKDIEKEINRLLNKKNEKINNIEKLFKTQMQTLYEEKDKRIEDIESIYSEKINIIKDSVEQTHINKIIVPKENSEEKIVETNINNTAIEKKESKTLIKSLIDLPLVGNAFGFAFKKYEEAKETGEQHIYFLTLIASIFMMLGVFWGLDFVIEKGIITLEYRVMLFGLLSVSMICGGIYLLKSNKVLGLSLFGTGFLSFHFVFYFTTSYYNIINLNIGFLFLTICSISAFYLSYRLKDNVIYFLTMLATITVPLFFSNTVVLNEYLAVFDIFSKQISSISNNFVINQFLLIISLFVIIGISTFVAVRFDWKKLLFLGFLVFGSLFDAVMTMNNFNHLLSLVSVNILAILFISGSLFNEYKNKNLSSVTNKVYLFIISVYVYFIGNALYLSETFKISMPIMLGVIFTNLALLIIASKISYKKNETLFSTFVLLIMSLIAIALFSVFDSSFKYLLFVESVIFIMLAYRHNIKLIKIEALIMFVISTVNMFENMATSYSGVDFKISSGLLLLSFATSVFLFNYNKVERWVCRIETFTLSVLSIFTFVIMLVFSFSVYDNHLLFGEALNFNILIPVIAFALIIFNRKKATQLVFWSYALVIALVSVDIIFLGKIPRIERIFILSYLFGTAYWLIKHGSTKNIKRFGLWTQKFAFLLIPLGIVSFGLKNISHDYLSYTFLAGFAISALASKFTPSKFNMKHLYNIEATILFLVSVFYFGNPLIAVALVFFVSFTLKEHEAKNIFEFGNLVEKVGYLLIPLGALGCIHELGLLVELKKLYLLGFVTTVCFSRIFPKKFDLRKFFNIEASVFLICLVSLYNFNILLVITTLFYISFTVKQFSTDSAEQAGNRLNKIGFLLMPIALIYYPMELLKISDMFIGLFITCGFFVAFYINKFVSKYFMELGKEYKIEGIIFLLIGNIISSIPIILSNMSEIIPSIISLLITAFIIYGTNLKINSKIRKVFFTIMSVSFYTLLANFTTIYAALVISIFMLLGLSIKANKEKLGVSKDELNKLSIIFAGLSSLILFDSSSSNALLYLLMANALVFVLYFNNLHKTHKGMSFIFAFITLNNYLLLNSFGNGYLSTYGLTFIMLLPCIYAFYSLFKYNFDKFNKIAYTMAGIILFKFFMYDLSAMKEMREFILIGLGILIFIFTYWIKKKKNKKA